MRSTHPLAPALPPSLPTAQQTPSASVTFHTPKLRQHHAHLERKPPTPFPSSPGQLPSFRQRNTIRKHHFNTASILNADPHHQKKTTTQANRFPQDPRTARKPNAAICIKPQTGRSPCKSFLTLTKRGPWLGQARWLLPRRYLARVPSSRNILQKQQK